MAGNVLTIKLVSNEAGTSSTTYTMSGSKDWVAAQQFVQQVSRDGGLFDDNGTFWFSSAISSISIS